MKALRPGTQSNPYQKPSALLNRRHRMSTQTTTPRDAAGPPMPAVSGHLPGIGVRSVRKSRLLLALTSGLLAALILNLVVFDDLRTDGSADVVGTFLAPQHLTSILACLLAVVLLAMRHRSAPRVALTVAWIEIVAFLFFHGLPFEIGPSKPYWGDGMGDALQWLGFALILACSASVVRVARPPRRPWRPRSARS
jgi:hypothetical protein